MMLRSMKPRTRPIATTPPVPRPPLPAEFDGSGELLLELLVGGLADGGIESGGGEGEGGDRCTIDGGGGGDC